MMGTKNIRRPIFRTSIPPNGGSSTGGVLKVAGVSDVSGSGAFSLLGALHPEFDDII
jgi:hypothetical protein